MFIAESISEMIHSLDYQDLSEQVIDRTKYLALDFIGLAARGNQFESSKPIHRFLKTHGGKGEGVVIGSNGLQVLPHYAALANGAASHSLELDDLINEGSVHPEVVIFPAGLAVADHYGKTGKELITAAVIGYEVFGKLGKALNPSHVYDRGFHPTGVIGAFASAATVSKLIGLTNEQIANALGIAGSMASGSLEFLQTGSWTKRLHPGWAAHNGIIAAELAKEGFTGPKTIIEGKNGFAKAYSMMFNPGDLTFDYSNHESFTLKTSIKPHACCRYKQGSLDIILDLVKTNDIKSEEVKEIKVYLGQTGLKIVGEPAVAKRNPQSSVDAQFSMHFGAAVAVLYRNTLLEQYDETVITRPEVKALMNKVFCCRDEGLEKDFPKKWPAKVMIDTEKGLFAKEVEYPKGDPENPLSWDEIIEKFNYVSSPVYERTHQTHLVDRIRNLDSLSKTKDLTELLKGGILV